MKRLVYLVSAALVVVLTGCGGYSAQDEDQKNYQDCTDKGGSYSFDGNSGSWSCKLPVQEPTATTTVTVSP